MKNGCVVVFVLALFACGACGADSDTLHNGNGAIEVRDVNYSKFIDALQTFDVLDDVADEKKITIFAVSNQAFDDVLVRYEPTPDKIRHWLKSHIVPKALTLDQIKRKTAFATLSGSDLHIRYTSYGVMINDDALIMSEEVNSPLQNGAVFYLDHALERSLKTHEFNITSYPDAVISIRNSSEFFFAVDKIIVDEEGYIHNFQLDLNIEHDRIWQLRVVLRHEESGVAIEALSSTARGADFQATLTDSADFSLNGDFLAGR